MTIRPAIAALSLLALTLHAPTTARAHLFVPAIIDIDARNPLAPTIAMRVDTHVRSTQSDPRPWVDRFAITPHGPCTSAPRNVMRDAAEARFTYQLTCDSADALKTLNLTINGDWNVGHELLIRTTSSDGRIFTRITRATSRHVDLDPTALGLADDAPRSHLAVFTEYIPIGVEHIWLGADHLLFVLLLLIAAANFRSLVATITAFTLAHSITLALATLDILTLPQRLVEALIAASIAILAASVLQNRRDHAHAKPWRAAFLFGLLHGLGFAGAILEVGVPRASIAPALLGFNVGVELGQLAFVAAVELVFVTLRHLRLTQLHDTLRKVAIYLAGGMSIYWFIERTALLFQ